jgi:NTE family protein
VLSGAGLAPDWVAGISIGAINAAIIAGNKPADRVNQLRKFWLRVTEGVSGKFLLSSSIRSFFNEASAAIVASFGVPGFFAPRLPPAIFMLAGTPEAISFYDTAPLKATLSDVVDLDVLNHGSVRYSAGAVSVDTGNFAFFDTASSRVEVEHVMASAALPPAFPAVVADGKSYWDGGLVSNTPLDYVMKRGGASDDLCVFQIDLFSARGSRPRSLYEVAQREKEIRYSSRTRLNTDALAERHKLRRAAMHLTAKLSPKLRQDPDAKLLEQFGCDTAITIVHLIHRRAAYERHSMDYEFSRLSMEEHWQAGRDDALQTLRHKAWRERKRPADGVAILDLTRDDSIAGPV